MYQAEYQDLADMHLAREIAETLHEHYPGHMWAVNIKSGIIDIKNFYISDSYGMCLHYDKLGDATERKKKVIMAGGEFLERAHMARKGFQEQTGILEGRK